ncbi:hypothetical protein V1503_19045 [Bacillus sp. SCS-151]|uniref:hypothetical protein n=1 Tax=Nanhaiella sioensis TaxID=3115293 RepID=UPI00397C4ED3
MSEKLIKWGKYFDQLSMNDKETFSIYDKVVFRMDDEGIIWTEYYTNVEDVDSYESDTQRIEEIIISEMYKDYESKLLVFEEDE